MTALVVQAESEACILRFIFSQSNALRILRSSELELKNITANPRNSGLLNASRIQSHSLVYHEKTFGLFEKVQCAVDYRYIRVILHFLIYSQTFLLILLIFAGKIQHCD